MGTTAASLRSEFFSVYGSGYFERGEGSNYISYGDDPGWELTVAEMRHCLPPSAHVLEIGAAKGYFVRAARLGGFRCVGVDVSDYAVSQAVVEVQCCDVTRGLDFEDGSFDAVVSWEVLEHVPEPDIAFLSEEMDRVLAPGGLQLHRIGVLIPGREAEFFSDKTHVTPWGRSRWAMIWSGYHHIPSIEKAFDSRFSDRDWSGRFFAYRKPE